MQESYGEGLASHTGPESGAQLRKGTSEAWIGEGTGEVIEPRKHDPVIGRVLQGADAVEGSGRPHAHVASARREATQRGQRAIACSDTSRAGTGKVPGLSARVRADRIGKSLDERR